MIVGFKVERCPHCGKSQESLHLRIQMNRIFVGCVCGAKGPSADSYEEAVEKWNHRYKDKEGDDNGGEKAPAGA